MRIVTSPTSKQVKELFENNDCKTFRYFNKRPFDCIEDHLFTVLIYEKDKPIGYGHLDPEGNVTWLGIYLSPNYRGKGYAKIIMGILLSHAKDNIQLTVDKNNTSAVSLYDNFGFVITDETETYYIMEFENV
tara:strand:- start:4406 stop:4801 length:396 start_codon:yes stop_codon:yes gene_type:complete